MAVLPDREYYGVRKGGWKQIPLDFEMLKRSFISIFTELREKGLFDEALGYEQQVEDMFFYKNGLWGKDVGAFFFRKLGRELWPFEPKIQNFEDLFSVIEFLYDYISKTKFTRTEDVTDGRQLYRNQINESLKAFEKGYQLSENGEVQFIAPSGLESLIKEEIKTDEPENIDNRIEHAKSLFLRYNATPDDKKEAIRTLGDVFEYLTKSNRPLPNNDESALFQILNRFGFRHHNRTQLQDYDKDIFYDWTFYVLLSSIYAQLKLNARTEE